MNMQGSVGDDGTSYEMSGRSKKDGSVLDDPYRMSTQKREEYE